jgi:hypothetical protein
VTHRSRARPAGNGTGLIAHRQPADDAAILTATQAEWVAEDHPQTQAEWVARGKAVAESGKYVPRRGPLLGRLESWGLDVYENSPQQWIDALTAEQTGDGDGAQ